jgi:gas vesicle protein
LVQLDNIATLLNGLWVNVSSWLTWENTKAFGNSSFFTSLIGALAGAFAGAYAAQRIAEREKIREELIKEIRNTNAAIMSAFDISNSLLSLKKQHVKSLKENFDTARAQLIELKRKLDSGEIQSNKPFFFKGDLRTLPRTQLPIDILRNQVFERLTVGGRPLSLVTSLIQSIELLNSSIDMRNQLIEKYQESKATENPNFPARYFGLPYAPGHVDLNYPNAVEGIYNYTDDGIFYSQLLCRDLNDHGKSLVEDFKKHFRTKAPRINEADFQKAQAAGLMPANEAYADWLQCFVKGR